MALDSFTIQQIFDVQAFSVVDGSLLFFSEDLKTATVENAEEVVYSMGGVGNPYINGDSHSKRTTISTEAATFNLDQVGLITGTDVVEGVATVTKNEVLTVNTDSATTAATAVGTAGSEIISAQVVDNSGSVTQELTQVGATPATGEFSYESGTKALTFLAGDLEDGTLVRVVYEAETAATAKTITNSTNTFAATAKFIFGTLVKDKCGVTYAAQLIVPKAKVNGTWSFDIAADGDPAVLAMDLEALKNCGADKLWDLVLYDDSELA